MIQNTADLKTLSLEELEELCKEMRRKIIDVLAVNGGHLGSNLGIVELCVALHTVFSSPEDKFIFDVSHQTYPHKLLTGRGEQFHRVRCFKGLCGFASPKESPHDHFYAGHAGTALSTALGLAKNRDLSGRDEWIVPILGDASLTCGLTHEALNNIPQKIRRFLIVLNDNDMSISSSVGTLSHLLKKGGAPAYFQPFGLDYVGPVDGHDIASLIATLKQIKERPGPLLFHALTTKGRGMESATQNPISWHGCRPFDKVTGKILGETLTRPTFPKIFGKHLLKMAENDPSLVVVTPAMPLGSCLTPLMQKFPERCLDVGIAEGHAVAFCGGIAYGKKMKVICSIYATFLQRAFDNLFQEVCLQEFPVVFALDRAGLSAEDGSTHHGIYDISFLNAMPNMVICQPRDGQLLKELLESAFYYERPVAIRYPNMATDEGIAPLSKREIGKGEILVHGSKIALVALGHMTITALEVRTLLASEGIAATVVDPIFIKPFDSELFYDILTGHSCVVTLEEHALSGGLGTLFNSFVVRNGFGHLQILNFGIPDAFVEQGSYKELIADLGLDASSIARQILKAYHEVHDHSSVSS